MKHINSIFDDFNNSIDNHWTQVNTGSGKLSVKNSILRMEYESAKSDMYTDSQIDDYTMLGKKDYLWEPPLRMTVRSRTSHHAATKNSNKDDGFLNGTAGFGFWNKPFTMQGNIFTLPESVWFFYSSPPSNMKLVPDLPGFGWKAQVVHTMRWGAIPTSIPLALTGGYAKITGNDKYAAKWMQRFSGTDEKVIEEDMTEWHTYTLEWRKKEVIFFVDEKCVLRTKWSPTRPLGFVAWLDNEYAIATPFGELKFGKMASGKQWLDIDFVKIEKI